MTEEEVDEFLRDADLDKDGNISPQDLTKMLSYN